MHRRCTIGIVHTYSSWPSCECSLSSYLSEYRSNIQANFGWVSRMSRISVVFYEITYMKQIEYDKCATYIGTIHSKCFWVSRISVVFYIMSMKQIQYNKDYIGTIHSKCYRVSRISVVFYKITYMKQIEYDNYATYIGTIHSKCYQFYHYKDIS